MKQGQRSPSSRKRLHFEDDGITETVGEFAEPTSVKKPTSRPVSREKDNDSTEAGVNISLEVMTSYSHELTLHSSLLAHQRQLLLLVSPLATQMFQL